jgi:hypothetical protein
MKTPQVPALQGMTPMGFIDDRCIFQAHGSPYDRGSADSYYRRSPRPHKGGVGGDSGPEVTNLTQDELLAYHAGYNDNEVSKNFKEF